MGNIAPVVDTGLLRAIGPAVMAGALLVGCASSTTGSGDSDLAGVGGRLLQGDGQGGEADDGGEPGGSGDGAVRLTSALVTLRGDDEVPGPGVDAASGTAEVVIVQDRDEVCVEIVVRDLDQPSAAHLHQGPPGEAGDVVLALPAPAEGTGSVDGCVTAAPKVLERLVSDPAGFYVNVHSLAAPDGALRGQLG